MVTITMVTVTMTVVSVATTCPLLTHQPDMQLREQWVLQLHSGLLAEIVVGLGVVRVSEMLETQPQCLSPAVLRGRGMEGRTDHRNITISVSKLKVDAT